MQLSGEPMRRGSPQGSRRGAGDDGLTGMVARVIGYKSIGNASD